MNKISVNKYYGLIYVRGWLLIFSGCLNNGSQEDLGGFFLCVSDGSSELTDLWPVFITGSFPKYNRV